MNEFYQGVSAAISILVGLCAFNYWVFNLMEKRLEIKLNLAKKNVANIDQELKGE